MAVDFSMPVLVVDDNATNRRLLHDLLVRWHMRPQVAASGPEALAALRQAEQSGRPHALVLLDARMPGMDGFQVAEQLCRQTGGTRGAVMMLSSADLSEEAEHCRALGVTYLETSWVPFFSGITAHVRLLRMWLLDGQGGLDLYLLYAPGAAGPWLLAALTAAGYHLDRDHAWRRAHERRQQKPTDD